MKVVLTAGGIGTRLLPFSKEIPKEMAPVVTRNVDGSVQVKPIIHAIFEQLYAVGFRDYFIVVGRGKRAIQDHFTPDLAFVSDLEKKGKRVNGLTAFYDMLASSNIVFINQPEPRGFGDAVLRTKPYLDGEFLVYAGDTLILSDGNAYIERLRRAHWKHKADATILLKEMEDPRQLGVVTGQEVEPGILKIHEAVEKPARPKSRTAIMPIYIFTESVFQHISGLSRGKGGEIQLTDAIQSMIDSGKRVLGVKLKSGELWLDIGSPETLLSALKLSGEYLGR